MTEATGFDGTEEERINMTDHIAMQLQELLGEENVRRQEPMSLHTSFRVGGPADLFVRTGNPSQLQAAIHILEENGISWFILGKGTNLLVGDQGYRGCVITMNGLAERPVTDTAAEAASGGSESGEDTVPEDFSRILAAGNVITAGAGASLAKTAQLARANGLSGLEFAAGIPGSVGGGLVMNAGAYDGSMDLVVEEAQLLMPDGKVMTVPKKDLRLGYRRSVLKEIPAVALQVKFVLKPGDPDEILAKMQDFAERRRSKQPLEYPSAGSVFKNNHAFGAPSGKLIDDCGLKGLTCGGAQIAPFHGNFIINTGSATAADIKTLVSQAQKAVYEKFGFNLELEIIFI